MNLPESVVLELTYRCNHKCLFCSCPWENVSEIYERGKELSLDEWRRAIDILLENGVKIFSISGGEAILRSDAGDILSYLREELTTRGIDSVITLISNGLAMTEDWLHFVKDNNIHLSMSLPGVKTFCKHTGVDNAAGVLKWFRRAKSMGLKVTANVTVTKINIHELQDTIALALLYGANDILLNRFLPGGRGLSHMKELIISTSQLNYMLDTAEKVLSLANRHGNVGTEIPLCSIDSPMKYEQLHIGYRCAAATGFFVVGPAGEIRTCNHSPKKIGHIFDERIVSDTDYWNIFVNEEQEIKECRGCIGHSICSCGCREVASILKADVNSADPSLDLRHRSLYM